MSPIPPYTPGGGGVSQAQVDASIAAAVSDLVDGAPGVLDTLNELAAAMGDDPSFLTTLNTAIGNANTAIGDLESQVGSLVVVSGMFDSAVHGTTIGAKNARPIGQPAGSPVIAPEGFYPVATVVNVTTPFASASGTAIIALGYLEATDAMANPLFSMTELDGTPSVVRKLGATAAEPAGVGSNVRVWIQTQALTAGALEFHSIGFIV